MSHEHCQHEAHDHDQDHDEEDAANSLYLHIDFDNGTVLNVSEESPCPRQGARDRQAKAKPEPKSALRSYVMKQPQTERGA